MKHRILHIFASKQWGGGEQYVLDLAQKQCESGHFVSLLSGKSNIIAEKIKQTNYPYFAMRKGRFNPFSILKLLSIIRENEIDIIHCHQFGDAFLAAFALVFISEKKRPDIILTRHLIRKGKSGILYQWLYRRIHRLIFVSEKAKTAFLSGTKLSEEKIAVIHNSIFLREKTAHIDFRKICGLKNDTSIVGFVGQIAEFKGVELLLEVAEKTADIAFLLAGKGKAEYEAYLIGKIAEKHLQNRFFLLGFLSNPADFILQTDIGILPSLCEEAFGLTVLEFMQAGIPVIASNSGGQTEFVRQGETGLLVSPNVEEITAALTQLINNNDFAKKIGKNAKLFAEKEMSYEAFFAKIMAVYDEK